GNWGTDYKTTLQEVVQKSDSEGVFYNVTKESGPDHDKVFQVEVVWKNAVLGIGIGKSKKQAEQKAAQAALLKITGQRKI
ncbi:MAG: putative dsRNA-binding protein, partial [Tepidanaerobacteraceae bacterium]